MTLLHLAALPSIGLWAAFAVGWLLCYLGGQRDRQHYHHSLPLVLVNVGLVNVGVVAVCALRSAWNPFWERHTVWMFLAFFACVDVLGWAGHWLVHKLPSLSKKHSSYHHRQREPYGIDQFYQHPVDNLLLFILPGLLAVGILPRAVRLGVGARGARQHALAWPVRLGASPPSPG
jgi:sterol desaturase/sphingolipid hydroxylase (fatty acid hydroxylase superfamily)